MPSPPEKAIRGSNAEKVRVLPLMGIALAVVATGVLLDAVFQLSRPSLFSGLGALEVLAIIINALALVLIPAVAVSLTAAVLTKALGKFRNIDRLLKQACLFVFSLAFILVLTVHADTWMYTTFNLDVSSLSQSVNRILLLVIPALSFVMLRGIGTGAYRTSAGLTKYTAVLYSCLFLLLIVSSAHRIATEYPYIADRPAPLPGERGLPNIILFSIEGVDADHMSVYGYDRKTTPNLDELAKSSLVFKRAYSNCGDTTGSVTSLLTGKSPASTKVIYPPDILRGKDAYEHLPGILADLGYYCLDVGDVVFGMPSKINMQMAFHGENGRETGFGAGNILLNRIKRIFNPELYFLSEILERVTQRIGYMAGTSRELLEFRTSMDNFMLIGEPDHYSEENRRFFQAIRTISDIDRPVFAHMHFLRTHGPRFTGIHRLFSKGKLQEKDRDPDFFDDAILTADHYFGLLLNSLKESGKFEDSLIVFLTDHGLKDNRTIYPLPLVAHLPGQKKRRTIEAPVQYLDIPPSVLEHLEVAVPQWMEGDAIFGRLEEDMFRSRPIFGFKAKVSFNSVTKSLVRNSFGPPLYGIGRVSVLLGDLSYIIHVDEKAEEMLEFTQGPFNPEKLEDRERKLALREKVLSFLKKRDIYISSVINTL
jgi:arylsulfatase A-like enzyme